MHFFKEYIENYNNAREELNTILNNIEKELDGLLKIRNISTIELCKQFLDEHEISIECINDNINSIVQKLNDLQKFCYEDIKNILPFIPEFSNLDEKEAFLKAKNIDYLIECIKSDKSENMYEKNNLLEIAEFNKKVRYFIHTTLAIVENPSAYVIQRKLEKNIKEDKFVYSVEDLFYEVNYLLSEVYRIKRLLEQYHILSNPSYGNWTSSNVEIKDIINYINIYKERFEGYYFNEKLYCINVVINNNIQNEKKLYLPIDKLKEIIDVLLHNAADELVSKEIEKGKFEKYIVCEIEEVKENIVLKISDNGRGFGNNNDILNPFVTTKSTKFHNQGIGLDIANTNCILISGKLEKENMETGGALFKVTFPKNVIVNTDAFKYKINIAVFGKSIELNNKLEELKNLYKDGNRVININSIDELNMFLQNASLNALDIIIIDKNDIFFRNRLKQHSFKGQMFIV